MKSLTVLDLRKVSSWERLVQAAGLEAVEVALETLDVDEVIRRGQTSCLVRVEPLGTP